MKTLNYQQQKKYENASATLDYLQLKAKTKKDLNY